LQAARPMVAAAELLSLGVMTSNFQPPPRLALCIFSGIWLIGALWFGVSFAVAGKILAAVIMAVFGVAALGLWFQSRVAAWTLIAFACAGILFSLLKIGHAPVLRIISPIAWAVWAIMLLVEYLRGETSS
jgi:hypothetical protein